MIRKAYGLISRAVLLGLIAALTMIGATAASAEGLGFGPENISTYGAAIDGLYMIILYITGVVFIGVEVLLVVFIIKYRGRKDAKARGDVHGNHILEIWWSSIPAVILVILAVMGQRTWAQIRNPANIPKDAIPIEVSARQFAWDIRYAGPDGKFGKTDPKLIIEENPFGIDPNDPDGKDDIVKESQMCVPVGKPVKVTITSKDVIHSFFLPNVRIKQDAVPGMKVSIWFQVTKTTAEAKTKWKQDYSRPIPLDELDRRLKSGAIIIADEEVKGKDGNPIVTMEQLLIEDEGATTKALREAGRNSLKAYPEFDFQIVCAELCGNGHFKMKGTFLVETADGFKKWLEDNKKS